MKLPNVDLTDAAAELGITKPPQFIWSQDSELVGNAEYDPTRERIRAHPSVFIDWAHTGMAKTLRIRNARNGLRFTAAHELAHLWQERRDPTLFIYGGDYVREMRHVQAALRPGMTTAQLARAHRRNKYEAEADAVARRIWRKVKLT